MVADIVQAFMINIAAMLGCVGLLLAWWVLLRDRFQ